MLKITNHKLTALALVAALATTHPIAQSNFWYDAPFGTSVQWYQNNFGNWMTSPVSDFSMPGAATNGNSFFVLKGDLRSDGNIARPSRLYQRVGTGAGTSWIDWGNRYPNPEQFSLRAPVMTAMGVNVRAKTNLTQNTWFEMLAVSQGAFTATQEAGFHGTHSMIPGTNRHIGPVKSYSAWYQGDFAVRTFSNGLPTKVYSNTPIGEPLDICATSSNVAFAVSNSGDLWMITDPAGLGNSNVLQYNWFGSFFNAVSDSPGNDVRATDWNGDVWWVSSTGATFNLGKPTAAGVWSHPVAFDGGKHYTIVAADTGNGKQRLYYRAYDWGIQGWLTWAPLPNLPSYSGPYGIVPRHIVGSPVLDEQAKRILVVDQEGGYWRGGWNWNESAWQWWNCGKP